MEILIKITDGKTRLSLIEEGKEQDTLEILEERTLSEKLLPTIDELLKRNKLESRDVGNMRVETDKSDSFTTTRIAKTIAKTWNEMRGF